ncbi:MAG: protein kinase domain-containing protein [Polyangiales bacterium]
MAATATESGEKLHEGLLVGDKYRLVSPAGEGAMGSVWKAAHITLGHTVAIKFLHGSVANAAEPRARFEREAKLAARLGEASRHITRVMDHGVMPDGTPFLVMEFLQGEGLEVRLKRERRLPIPICAKITSQLARALFVAHGAGVIHRDLKPANVFLCESEDGEGVFVKLLDFGVAKATLDADENQATRAGALIGTPNYMSPEQITGVDLDARSDLWGLAAIVYRMAVGRAPFGSGSLSELAMRIVSTEPPTPTALAPDLPHEFDLWVQKGLAKKAEARFQNARELADSLAMVSGISSAGTTGAFSSGAAERLALALGDSAAGLSSTVHEASQTALPAPKKKSKTGLFVAIAVFAVIGGVAGFVLTRKPVTAPTAATKPEAPPPAKVVETSAPPKVVETAAKPVATVAAPEPSASAEPEAKKAVVALPKGKGAYVAPAKATTKAESAGEATPPPPPTPTADPSKKSGEMWNKKDEM